MKDEIRDSIQENHASRKLNILKGFSDLDDVFEKAVYADNAQNQKLGRVGKTYGGAQEEKPAAPKPSKNKPDDPKEKTAHDPAVIQGHLAATSSDTLKKFISNKKNDPALIEFAKKELEDRGKDEATEKKEAQNLAAKNKPAIKKTTQKPAQK